jgi:hypothetical protein
MSEHVWQKSSFSEGGSANCVEVSSCAAGVPRLREGDDPGTVLTSTPARLRPLLDAIRGGALDDLTNPGSA